MADEERINRVVVNQEGVAEIGETEAGSNHLPLDLLVATRMARTTDRRPQLAKARASTILNLLSTRLI